MLILKKRYILVCVLRRGSPVDEPCAVWGWSLVTWPGLVTVRGNMWPGFFDFRVNLKFCSSLLVQIFVTYRVAVTQVQGSMWEI